MTSPGGKGLLSILVVAVSINTAPKKTSWRLNTTKPVTASAPRRLLSTLLPLKVSQNVVKMMRRSVAWPISDKGGFARSSQASSRGRATWPQNKGITTVTKSWRKTRPSVASMASLAPAPVVFDDAPPASTSATSSIGVTSTPSNDPKAELKMAAACVAAGGLRQDDRGRHGRREARDGNQALAEPPI